MTCATVTNKGSSNLHTTATHICIQAALAGAMTWAPHAPLVPWQVPRLRVPKRPPLSWHRAMALEETGSGISGVVAAAAAWALLAPLLARPQVELALPWMVQRTATAAVAVEKVPAVSAAAAVIVAVAVAATAVVAATVAVATVVVEIVVAAAAVVLAVAPAVALAVALAVATVAAAVAIAATVLTSAAAAAAFAAAVAAASGGWTQHDVRNKNPVHSTKPAPQSPHISNVFQMYSKCNNSIDSMASRPQPQPGHGSMGTEGGASCAS